MKKKILAAILILAILASMAACGGTSSDTDTQQQSQEESSVSTESREESTTQGTLPPTVVDYGYVVIEGYDGYYVEYAYQIKNENVFDIKFPTVRITARGEDDSILATEEDVRGYISAGDTIAQASQLACSSMPASIEVTGLMPDDYDIVTNNSATSSADFEIFNVSLQGDSVTGEITNISENDYDSGYVVTAIFRDAEGKIISGATSYEYSAPMNAGDTTPFEIHCYFDPAEYSYETITVTAYGEIM